MWSEKRACAARPPRPRSMAVVNCSRAAAMSASWPPTILGCGDVLHDRWRRADQPPRVCISRCGSRLQRVAGDERRAVLRRRDAPRRRDPRAPATRRGRARRARRRSRRHAAGRADRAPRVAYRQVKSCPSAVSRARSQSAQNGSVVEAITPITWPAGQDVARRRRSVGAARSARAAPKAASRRARISPRGTTRVGRPVRGAADVHVFDEADLGADAAGVARRASTSSSSFSPRITTVSILTAPNAADGGGDAGEHGVADRVSATGARSDRRCSVSRLTVTRSSPAARRAAAGAASWTPLVVSARSREAAAGGQPGDEARQIAAQQRLAAGQPHARHALRRRRRRTRRSISSKRQQVRARQPDVLRLGHAVEAAQVAAVGHRHAQRAQWAAESRRARASVRLWHSPTACPRRRSLAALIGLVVRGRQNVISVHGRDRARKCRCTPYGRVTRRSSISDVWPSTEMSVYCFLHNCTGMSTAVGICSSYGGHL